MQGMIPPLQMQGGLDGKAKASDASGKGGLPDSESPLYHTDPFRMYCFKVLPCSKRYCHDWTFCPFAHPGEKAKRRDPRVYNYNGIACPEMKKNMACPRGDTCPYAHNVFEYWLHPSRYRTQLCNDGANCKRKVCFFAHTLEELRVPCKSLSGETVQLDPFAVNSSAPSPPAGVEQRLSAAAAAAQAAGLLGQKAKSAHPGLSPLTETDAWGDPSLNSPIGAWNPLTWSSGLTTSSLEAANMLAMRRRSCEVQSNTPLVQPNVPRRHSIDHTPGVGVQQLAETLANLELAERLGGKQNIVNMLGNMLARESYSSAPAALSHDHMGMLNPTPYAAALSLSSPMLGPSSLLLSSGLTQASSGLLTSNNLNLAYDQSSLTAANLLGLPAQSTGFPMPGYMQAPLSQGFAESHYPVTSSALAALTARADAAEADQLLSAAFSAAAAGHAADDLE